MKVKAMGCSQDTGLVLLLQLEDIESQRGFVEDLDIVFELQLTEVLQASQALDSADPEQTDVPPLEVQAQDTATLLLSAQARAP